MIWFTIPGQPQAQKRHRHCQGGKRTYDPSSADKKAFLAASLNHAPPQPLEGALELVICFSFQRPKSHLTSKGALRKGYPEAMTRKPDADNLIKFVKDALNGVFYVDDAQFVTVIATKKYAETASTSLIIRKL